jgi:hypothetical protein
MFFCFSIFIYKSTIWNRNGLYVLFVSSATTMMSSYTHVYFNEDADDDDVVVAGSVMYTERGWK